MTEYNGYDNKGLRDILILPRFKNIDKIQDIRLKYDDLAEILPPHITVVHPFKSSISNEKLKELIQDVVKEIEPFKVKCKNISFEKNEEKGITFIFLNVFEGREIIESIHDKITDKLIGQEISKYEYKPHITLGVIREETNIFLDDVFEDTIDSMIVEFIGDNQESIFLFEVKLNK